MGSTTSLIQALQSFSLVFGFWSGYNVTPAHLTGHRSSDLHCHKFRFPVVVVFCLVEHCQLTTCNVWHEGLPEHFRPCQNTWAPHYAAARDWLKSKGVSTLTDRSGVVCSFQYQERISTLCPHLFSSKRNCIQIHASFSTKRDCIQIQASFSTKRDCIQVHATKGTAAFRYMHFVSQKMTNGISNKRVSSIQVHANHAINLTSSGPCALSLARKVKRVILPFSCERGPSFHWSLASSLQQWKLNSGSLPIARRGLTALKSLILPSASREPIALKYSLPYLLQQGWIR